MADQHTSPNLAALRKLEASIQRDMLEREALARGHVHRPDPLPTPEELGLTCWRMRAIRLWYRWRRWTMATAVLGCVALIGLVALWWRLGSGPIDFDVATPWLAAAIEENFGSHHRVNVGGAQLERDASGRTALRVRDIVVRDAHGVVVASAPKAEVGVSGSDIITGKVRARRLSLVGAEMQVRIEPDGRVTVFAGTNNQPLVTASAAQPPLRAGLASAPSITELASVPQPSARGMMPDLTALLAWIDGLGAAGLDGRDLSELGLKNGNLVVDDQRNGKRWTFRDINLSLNRPRPGSVALTISSEAGERPWMLQATMRRTDKNRHLEIETDRLPLKDLLLAMRVGDGQYEPNIPVSARIRAEIGPDGTPQLIEGRILLDSGFISDADDPLTRIVVDRAEFTLNWDASRQALMIPFQVVSGGTRLTLLAQLDAPRDAGGPWGLRVTGGTVVLAYGANDPDTLVLNRFLMRLRIDPDKQRIDIEQGEVGNSELALAISASLDYADEPRLSLAITSNRMSVAAMKRLWPSFINRKVRAWVEDHVVSGTVERILIATNAPIATLKTISPPIPEDGLAIEISGNGAEIIPVHGLPAIKDADVKVRITGRTASVSVGRGNIELSQGRKLAISSGTFEVPDHYPNAPPARARFRLDGPVSVAAELLNLPRLREFAGSPIDAATSRGTMVAYVALGMLLREDLPPGSAQYAINLDVSNFSAERLVMNQKVEAALLRVRADSKGYAIRGDVKVNGIPAVLDYRKARGEPEAEVRLAATLDEVRARQVRFRSERIRRRRNADQDQRPRPARRRRQPLLGRGRPDAGAHRQASARLGQAGRSRCARKLHSGQRDRRNALRRHLGRRGGHAAQGLGRDRPIGQRRGCELSRVPAVRRRPRDAQGRSLIRRRAPHHAAWRGL